jgi:hypothetical protein
MALLDRIQKLISRNEKHNVLSPWEKEFLQSLEKQAQSKRTFSVKQNSLLQKIESKLSTKAIKETTEWEKNWDEEKRQTARACAEYYKHAGYFSSASARILADPEWVMPQEYYEKMCCNKYAKKVLDALSATPLYEPGTVVALRATAKRAIPLAQFLKLKKSPLFVLEVLPLVRKAVKGAKIYKVLSGTCTKVFEIEERFLKKFKKG